MMTVFFQQMLNGVIQGCIYALIALGLSLIFGILEVANFAHGEFYMLGAFMALFSVRFLHVPFFVAMLIAMGGMTLFGILVERTVFRPIVGKPLINSMLLSFGLSTALANAALFSSARIRRRSSRAWRGSDFGCSGFISPVSVSPSSP